MDVRIMRGIGVIIIIAIAAKKIGTSERRKIMNARLIVSIVSIVAITAIFGGISAEAGNVKVNLNINLDPVRPVIIREEVYRPPTRVRYAPAPAYTRRDEVRFIYPDELGFHVAVGVAYDLCYIGNSYYLFNDGRWLRAHSQRGPWVAMRHRELPVELRQHRIERIRDYRQHGYASHREREHSRDRYEYNARNMKGERSKGKDHIR
jgi:hypothetical protein